MHSLVLIITNTIGLLWNLLFFQMLHRVSNDRTTTIQMDNNSVHCKSSNDPLATQNQPFQLLGKCALRAVNTTLGFNTHDTGCWGPALWILPLSAFSRDHNMTLCHLKWCMITVFIWEYYRIKRCVKYWG